MKLKVKVLRVQSCDVEIELPGTSATKTDIEVAAIAAAREGECFVQTVDYQVEGIVPC
jgi:hypothetical protein